MGKIEEYILSLWNSNISWLYDYHHKIGLIHYSAFSAAKAM